MTRKEFNQICRREGVRDILAKIGNGRISEQMLKLLNGPEIIPCSSATLNSLRKSFEKEAQHDHIYVHPIMKRTACITHLGPNRTNDALSEKMFNLINRELSHIVVAKVSFSETMKITRIELKVYVIV